MRLRAFFSGAIIFIAVAPTQMAAVELSSLTAKTAHTSTPSPTTGNSTLLDGATVKPTLLISQQSRTRRIRFARGASSAVVEDAVVRGTRDIYLLRAREGQTMIINITSLEKNAVFDIQAPNGELLKEEATSWRGVLPSSGDYSIIVGGTRGNASYKLEVTIR
jgi:hypothetical protein